MSKKYFCDHCEMEIYYSNKVSITNHSDIGGFNILKGETTDKFFIHKKNFDRLDYCNVDHMVRGITGNKYRAIEIERCK